MLRQNEFGILTPNPKLVDGLTDGDFTLGLVTQFLDLLALLDHHGDGVDQVLELHVVQGYVFREFEDSEEPLPVLLLEGLARAQLDQRPGLLILFNLLQEEADDHVLLLLFEDLLLLNEEVLEGIVALLPVGQPLFLGDLVHFLFELVEQTPGVLGFFQLSLHHFVVLELGRCFSEMPRIFVELLDLLFEIVPLRLHLGHHSGSLFGLLES
mmetsp:Transcript_23934/g.36623  ORF Transcript_23934/g.36623 Transcript_23934/m.36623 type:complete len:211 (-) Transcript_23934:3235-3867(-)